MFSILFSVLNFLMTVSVEDFFCFFIYELMHFLILSLFVRLFKLPWCLYWSYSIFYLSHCFQTLNIFLSIFDTSVQSLYFFIPIVYSLGWQALSLSFAVLFCNNEINPAKNFPLVFTLILVLMMGQVKVSHPVSQLFHQSINQSPNQ